MTRRYRRSSVVSILASLIITIGAIAQIPGGFQIQGTVISNKIPLPGATIVAVNGETSAASTVSTDLNGQYALHVASAGKYRVSAQMAAFGPGNKEIDVSDPSKAVRADFELTLVSRLQRPAGSEAPQPELTAGPGAAANPLSPTENVEGSVAGQALTLPGMAADAPTESVAVAGNTATPGFGGAFDLDRLAQLGVGGDPGSGGFGGPEGGGPFDGARGAGGPGGIGPGARGAGGAPGAGRGGPGGGGGRGPGGFGGGRGGGGGGGGRGGFVLAGQRGRNANQPIINLGYTLGDSVFDAAPYSLRGAPSTKSSYSQNQLNFTMGGPLVIPKIIDSSANTFYAATYNGSFSRNPFDVFSTVPTLSERSGDFSQTLKRGGTGAGTVVEIINPQTGLPFVGNRIPSFMIDPAASGLLAYIPEPNLPGATQNFHTSATNKDDGNAVNIRINHTFSAAPQAGRGGFGRGGGGLGRGGGRGRSAIGFGFQYRSQDSSTSNAFPQLGGETSARGFNIPVNYSRPLGPLSSNLVVSYNRNRTSATSLFSNTRDIAGALGITGVAAEPFDWGLPILSFTNYSGLNDVRPSFRLNQTVSVGESLGWSRGKHNVRFGGDFRYNLLNSHTAANARGSFTFNGAATQYDFSDFLLGLPQLTSVQYGSGNYNFRGNSWDGFIQDDWRLRGNLTLNLGLRYDYVAPLTESGNRLVNLDAPPDFAAVAPVLPGQAGAFTGIFPRALVNPDRNNFAPQAALAWRPVSLTVIRAGYGIAYNTGVYNSIAQQLAFQPPFSVTQTNIAEANLPLTLENGFPPPVPGVVTNNFGVDKNYRVGYAQTWNASIQRQLPKGMALSIDYTGAKGSRLDILQAPNRVASGLRIAGVQPFTWETSTGNSIAHVGRVQVRRRLTNGVSIGGNYTFSKAIDDASSFGAAAGVIAQDAFNLSAERALSSFDQPHRFNGDFLMQLPFGRNRRWLSGEGMAQQLFGDWQLSGTWNFASGAPLTARVIGDAADIRRGTNGTLRANATGLAIPLDNPTTDQWFNVAAFSIPATGTFGNAGRNTIRGPGAHQFDLALNKTFTIESHLMDMRVQAFNVFNIPQYRSVDTVVNSPTFGRVTSVGSMRKIQVNFRYRF